MPEDIGRDPPANAAARGAADAVLMVRPARFGWNPETEASNAFQREVRGLAAGAGELARSECDALAGALGAAGVAVRVFEDRADPVCPDAVFPNNWLSLHADGTAVLYPMLAPNRRRERRRDILEALEREGRVLRRVVDLSAHEARGEYLEGTGSLVLDHASRVAYACRSPRTHPAPLVAFCAALGYRPCVFDATGGDGRPVYHTNVVLSVGPSLAVVAAECIADTDRGRVLAELERTGRERVVIDRAQAARFAANVLELRAADGASVLALSAAAAAAFDAPARAAIGRAIDRVVAVPVPTIETLGGGSVRCMLAEIFLPQGSPR